MAETVLSFVLDQLSIFLREEGRLLGGLRQEVQLITDELGHMRAFLKVAEAKEEDDPRLQEWVKQVRDVAYDTEDVLDEFIFRFAHRRSRGFYGSVKKIFNSIKSWSVRHRIASEIQSIRTRMKSISEGHQRYRSEYDISDKASGSLVGVNNAAWRYSRDDALLVDEARLVGIDKPKQQLISQLLEGDSQFKVVSVVGMGGLGKTTLVKKVHEDAEVKRNFPIRAWVTVSQTFEFQDLLKSLIRQLYEEVRKPVPPLIDSMTTFELKSCVKDFLQQGRYAIVFDDVWDVEFWNEIKLALPENSCGNSVMLTTRIADVASVSCIETQSYVHKMQPLSFEESWTLFCNKTFEDKSCPAYLRDVAKTILSKCEGLPLAIVAISGLLAMKGVSKMDEWEIIRRSLGGELEGIGNLDRLKKILYLSYNNLPSHLKTCLLYMSIYPEDYEMSCHKLTQLWIAERFVERREGMTIEDVAWGYFRELVNRSLIQVSNVLYEQIPFSCRIHDILREIIISKSKKQNVITVSSGLDTSWPDKVRRLVINNFIGNNPQQSLCFKHLRSLIVLQSKEPLSRTLLTEILSSKLLKVLDFRGYAHLEEIPNEIFNLFHLKYLSLRGTKVKTVPKSIGKLQNLEYLNLAETEVKELPIEILKLRKLRHLWVYQSVRLADYSYGFYGCRAPSKIGELLALHALVFIDVGTAGESDETSAIVKEIGKLTQLRYLGITNLIEKDGKEFCYSLEKLTNLQVLEVCSVEKDEVIDLNYSFSSPSLQSLRMLRLWGHLEEMPQWITCLQGLVRIDLYWSGLMEDPLEFLQCLPNLVRVNMRQAYQGEGLCFKAGGFLKLKHLYLRQLKRLRWIKVEEGAMPCLQQLTLENLPLLVELPLGIQHLRQLQMLTLAAMSSQLTEKLENQGSEDYGQVAHIPQLVTAAWTEGEWRTRQLWGELKT